ncbi:aspartate kinase [Basidiobolus meristosporus CBS 931.73]|uniref:Aspartokinase n=1 Tax=Basidiobolus meristosporus CBS 931.73 TaxID=1314790 RepID=A0A1Y1YDZ2_9FUNG|nr:aspartate kinase [Basidiobolus meristosporus CBS 931.73]|eukprot:ORX96143.1 aspartate kinase [Basidiobolus meristosporus CBS 931.73]
MSIDQLIRNSEEKPWLVLKFGGTSIGKFLESITSTIVRQALKTHRVIIVCSARSGNTKSAGTTSQLISAAESVLHPKSANHLQILNNLMEDHLIHARESIFNTSILEKLEKDITQECLKLQGFLDALQVIGEVSTKSKDLIIGLGEKLASLLVVASLEDCSISSQLVCLDKIIDKHFDEANLNEGFYDYLSLKFSEKIHACDGSIPVVTGYFGPVPGGILQSIGRGYTDLTAALCAVGIRAEELQIWKEVDGIFTADPRKVPNARLLKIITPDEAAELTYYGSEVIHPFTMDQVIHAKIPIRIKNVQSPDGLGTMIFPDSNQKGDYSPHSPQVLLANGYLPDLSRRHPTAVTIKEDIFVLNVHSNRKSVSHGFFAKIFSILDSYGIPVDVIATSEVHVSMALGTSTCELHLNSAVKELSQFGTVDILRNMAILSLVGKQMRNMVGIAGAMFTSLAKANINIEMISQGASEINISCILSRKHADNALRVVHDSLLANVDYSELHGSI